MPDSRRIIDLHPSFIPLVKEWLAECNDAGYTLLTIATFRPLNVSEAYHARGRKELSKVNELYKACGLSPISAEENTKIITKALPGMSWHNYGLAVDFVPIVGGVIDWNYNPNDPADHYDEISDIAIKHGMAWGGAWRTFKDSPHVEWHPGWTINSAFNWAKVNRGDIRWLPIKEGK